MILLTILICAFTLFLSCNNILCGELSGEWKSLYEQTKSKIVNLEVEHIPCEFYYINVIVQNEKIDTLAIHNIHRNLYNTKSNIGWQVLQVYDLKKNYLFSHHFNGKIYVQNGD